MRHRIALPLAAVLLAATQTGAQAAPESPRPTAKDWNQVVTFSPILALGLWFTGDFEHRLTKTSTIGVGGTANLNSGRDDEFRRYASAELKWRYYPVARAPEGFSIAATGGFVTGEDNAIFLPNGSSSRSTLGTIGTELSYQWMLGSSERFAVVVGAGAKRLFDGELSGFGVTVIPTARVNIGFGF